MTGAELRGVAVTAAVVTAVAGVAVFWLAVRLPVLGVADPAGSAAAAPFVVGMVLLSGTGALLVRQDARSVIGWLLVTTGTSGVLARLTFALAVLAHDRGHEWASVLGWLTNWSWLPMQVLAMLLVLRFPDGRLPHPRWRPLQWVVIAWGSAAFLVTALLPGALGAEQLEPLENPVGAAGAGDQLELALTVLFAAQPALALAVVAAPIVRWRKAARESRQQLATVAAALLLVAGTAPLALAWEAAEVLEGLAWLVLPVSITYAVARHRLWDLDTRRRLDRLRAVREDERARLQRDLHDSLGPMLGAIAMRAEAARNLVAAGAPPADVDRLLATIGTATEDAVTEVRRFLEELGPSALAETDLVTALEEVVMEYSAGGLPVRLSVPAELPALDPAAESALYRVAVEAVRNVHRHARARSCHLVLRVEGADVVLDVIDDGIGLRGRPAGVGRRAMADRVAALGGVLALQEGKDGGVHLTARLTGAAG
ncbi:sensor histidine kinase [Nocardioides caldifontis]|uniref:sensor histidine kinase n=1 Tax=Nocardioides caldifontis TaxID=2588938 RepID=UPI0011DF87B6|nr:histidine kinase [Nocardioides caldifontis]